LAITGGSTIAAMILGECCFDISRMTCVARCK
jgi:hypothetical protein